MDKVRNLYLCGAGVHPGGGLPGVVTSAKVIERMIRRDMISGELAAPNLAEEEPNEPEERSVA
jgi:hypothetical protein